jgi:hypothetical protein
MTSEPFYILLMLSLIAPSSEALLAMASLCSIVVLTAGSSRGYEQYIVTAYLPRTCNITATVSPAAPSVGYL